MRKLLPLIEHPARTRAARSAMTCRYRCGDACFHEVPNTSDNEYVGDVIAERALAPLDAARRRRRDRRRRRRYRAVVAPRGARPPPRPRPTPHGHGKAGKADGARGLRFTPVAPNTADKVTVPEGYAPERRDPLGRADPARRPRLRPRQADRQGAGRPVRLQQRLPLAAPAPRRARAAGPRRQPRVHRRDPDVPRLRRRPTRPASRSRSPGPRTACPSSSSRRSSRTGKLTPVPRHPLNRRVTATTRVPGSPARPRARLLRTSADPTGTQGPRHAQQLRRRHHPVGHHAARRGELQPVLRQRRPAPPTSGYGIGTGADRAQVGAFRQALRRRAGAQRGRTASAGSSSSTRTTRTPRPRKRTALGRFKHEAASPG